MAWVDGRHVHWPQARGPEALLDVPLSHPLPPCARENKEKLRFGQLFPTPLPIEDPQLLVPVELKGGEWRLVHWLQKMAAVRWQTQNFDVVLLHGLQEREVMCVGTMSIKDDEVLPAQKVVPVQPVDKVDGTFTKQLFSYPPRL